MVALVSDLDSYNIDEPGAINGGKQPSSAGQFIVKILVL
jgi:hypothetical protein